MILSSSLSSLLLPRGASVPRSETLPFYLQDKQEIEVNLFIAIESFCFEVERRSSAEFDTLLASGEDRKRKAAASLPKKSSPLRS